MPSVKQREGRDNLKFDEADSSEEEKEEKTSTKRNARMVHSSSVAESLSVKSRSNSKMGLNRNNSHLRSMKSLNTISSSNPIKPPDNAQDVKNNSLADARQNLRHTP